MKSDGIFHNDVINRFKYCEGKPVLRASEVDKTPQGLRARGVFIVRKKNAQLSIMLGAGIGRVITKANLLLKM